MRYCFIYWRETKPVLTMEERDWTLLRGCYEIAAKINCYVIVLDRKKENPIIKIRSVDSKKIQNELGLSIVHVCVLMLSMDWISTNNSRLYIYSMNSILSQNVLSDSICLVTIILLFNHNHIHLFSKSQTVDMQNTLAELFSLHIGCDLSSNLTSRKLILKFAQNQF